ncbi:MAG: sugar ABC transporter substrate-binding protein, partial [Lachnospiraceae bacterium]|nr:sugar ABC transporter substrate-binding protein [Lachnospiraceae bacterium]
SAEALSFRSYYEEYIQKNYKVEFVYSDELKDAAGEKSAVDTMITNNCKAIISLSSFDRPAQIDQCSSAGVYYAVATGTLTQDEYEQYKSNEYYVGAVGPSLDIEYQVGYEMAKNYLDKGMTNFAIFGGAVAYRTEMHIYRVAGMLSAMIEAGGDGASYQGATDKDAIVGMLMGDGEVKPGDIGSIKVSGYLGGYDMDDAWFAKAAEMIQTSGLEAVLCVGNGSDFFGNFIGGTDVKIASVDALADTYKEAFDSGVLDYEAAKFRASIGPIFIAAYRAALGAPVRDADGNALALNQGYWLADNAAVFDEMYEADSNLDTPVYDKASLDTLLECDYETFASFVGDYDYDSLK